MSEWLEHEKLLDILYVNNLKLLIERQINCKIIIDEPLSKHTSWRVGGPAKLYAYPLSTDALGSLISFCNSEKISVFTIGYGTNLLVSDEGFNGCVIDLAEGARDIRVSGEELSVGGGAWLGEVVRIAAEYGLSGVEKLAGIPGGVGGALSMNAGAFGMSISDNLIDIETYDRVGILNNLKKEEIGFGYRSAPGFSDKTITQAKFILKKKSKGAVTKAVEDTVTDRFRRNVMTLPSAGSVFKNPIGGFSAKMVEAIGGKGLKEGGVEISNLHANFIVNTGGGCANDIVKLIQNIRHRVTEKFGETLELEVRTLGFRSNPFAQE